ncbi:ABC transporter permease [Roseomonas elaeocarpi]|uniref:ABC transporter permease n=1 Tax=Roseomonas elaeocarpi TaxID=907779 RepID=A0ABV6JME2_9PROT
MRAAGMARGMRAGGMGRASPLAPLTVAALLVLVALPVLFVVLQAVFPRLGAGSLAAPFSALGPALADPRLPGLLGNTLALGLSVVALSAVIALPLGACRALFRIPLAPLWDLLFLLPFMLPPYIATLGWIAALQPRGYLQQLVGFNLAGFLFSMPGIAVVIALHAFPVVYFAVSRTLEAVGGRLADVARVFGASPWRAFGRVTLPLAWPGLAASLLLVFAMAVEEYGTPAALGRSFGFEVLVTAIDHRVSDWPIDLPGAATLSLILVLLSVAAFALQWRLLARRSFETTAGKPQPLNKRPLGRWAVPVLGGFTVAAILATLLPIAAILAAALARRVSGGLALNNLGLQNFAAILGEGSDAWQALLNSLLLGLAAALLTGVLGTAAAVLMVRGQMRGRAALDALAMLPNALPGIVVAVGLILAWNQPALPITPYNTPLILILAYGCILLPYPLRYAQAALRQIGPNLEAAARVSGATPWRVMLRVLVPLMAPSLVAAMLLVFAVAARELVASLLVAPVGMLTVAGFIWRQFEQGSVGVGMAMAFVALAVTTLLPLTVLAVLRRAEQP